MNRKEMSCGKVCHSSQTPPPAAAATTPYYKRISFCLTWWHLEVPPAATLLGKHIRLKNNLSYQDLTIVVVVGTIYAGCNNGIIHYCMRQMCCTTCIPFQCRDRNQTTFLYKRQFVRLIWCKYHSQACNTGKECTERI